MQKDTRARLPGCIKMHMGTREKAPVRVPYIGKFAKKRECWRPKRAKVEGPIAQMGDDVLAVARLDGEAKFRVRAVKLVRGTGDIPFLRHSEKISEYSQVHAT